MNEYCFVMIHDYLNGCSAATVVVGVTLDQQYAYNWLHTEISEFISKRVEQVLFYPTAP